MIQGLDRYRYAPVSVYGCNIVTRLIHRNITQHSHSIYSPIVLLQVFPGGVWKRRVRPEMNHGSLALAAGWQLLEEEAIDGNDAIHLIHVDLLVCTRLVY